MKLIFKKNQIILTALAIMIAVVGYLNFARDKEKEADKEAALSAASLSLDEQEDELYADISAEDIGGDDYFQYQISDTGELVLSENQLLTKKEETDSKEETTPGAEPETEKENSGEKETAGQSGEGEDAQVTPEVTQQVTPQADGSDVKEEGDKEVDADAPGEAVLASVTIQRGYFSNARLNREQMRAKNKESLQSIISDSTVADELKQGAIDEVIALTARAEMENAAEILLEARGYEGVVVSMSETEVDVVVNAQSITAQQIAQIEDIVSRKTGIEAAGIVITTVIMEE